MLVVHGLIAPDQSLCLWAEDSDLAVKSPSQALRSARPHPFAALPTRWLEDVAHRLVGDHVRMQLDVGEVTEHCIQHTGPIQPRDRLLVPERVEHLGRGRADPAM